MRQPTTLTSLDSSPDGSASQSTSELLRGSADEQPCSCMLKPAASSIKYCSPSVSSLVEDKPAKPTATKIDHRVRLKELVPRVGAGGRCSSSSPAILPPPPPPPPPSSIPLPLSIPPPPTGPIDLTALQLPTFPAASFLGGAATSDGPWKQIPHCYSCKQLLLSQSSLETRPSIQLDDRVVYLPTFQSRVYVAYHAASAVEFDRFLPLMKYAVQDTWHRMPDAATTAQMKGLEDAGLTTGLPAIQDPRPKKLEVPKLHSAAALRTSETITHVPCENRNHSKYLQTFEMMDGGVNRDYGQLLRLSQDQSGREISCSHCVASKQAALKACGLIYISILKTVQDHYNPISGIPSPFSSASNTTAGPGTPIYQVVKSGSREEAASQAFYNAGANGWSTVFTLAVRYDIDWAIAAEEGFYRADELWELGDDQQGEVCVFY